MWHEWHASPASKFAFNSPNGYRISWHCKKIYWIPLYSMVAYSKVKHYKEKEVNLDELSNLSETILEKNHSNGSLKPQCQFSVEKMSL